MAVMIARGTLVVLLLAAACGGAAPPAAIATAPTGARTLVDVDEDGVALGGFDALAYASDDAPLEGSAEHGVVEAGATYWFASAERAAAFAAAPASYTARYGGYCAYAASQGRLTSGDAAVWMRVDGQLVLFANPEFRALFEQDPAGHRAEADRHWPALVAKHGTPAGE